jgi:hypothetical protein
MSASDPQQTSTKSPHAYQVSGFDFAAAALPRIRCAFSIIAAVCQSGKAALAQTAKVVLMQDNALFQE